MFGFFKRRKAYYGDSSTKTTKEQDELLSMLSFHKELDFSLFRNNDSVVKIKLPESIQLLLDELDNNRQINRSQLVRELLFA